MKKKFEIDTPIFYIENDIDSVPRIKRGRVLERLKPFRAGRWFIEREMDINGHKGRMGIGEEDIYMTLPEANRQLVDLCLDQIKRLADAIRQANR